MALASPIATSAPLKGSARPRIAPPIPAKSDHKALIEVGAELGFIYLPWQETAARYTEALTPDGRHLFREYCELVARQNGKTKKLVPQIVKRLRAARRIMHTAQNRDLPREVFAEVADIISQEKGMFRERNGRPMKPRFANGQEEITLANGGRYKIVAPTRGGARGGTNDDVIVDELREMETFEFIGAAKPTMTASPDPQIQYYSNAGEAKSVVLNAIIARAGKDPQLAFLEWSAAPSRAMDDPRGWAEANPALGHFETMYDYLAGEYRTAKLEGTLSIFEVEHLCRPQATTRPQLVSPAVWAASQAPLGKPMRPMSAISLHPSGSRASAATAWQQADGTMACYVLADVSPVDVGLFGPDLRATFTKLGAARIGYDPMTDGELAKHLPRAEKRNGRDFANDCATFVRLVELGKLRWDGIDIGPALAWTTRKDHESGAWYAVPVSDEQPITPVLAVIRAVGMAAGPRPIRPKVH